MPQRPAAFVDPLRGNSTLVKGVGEINLDKGRLPERFGKAVVSFWLICFKTRPVVFVGKYFRAAESWFEAGVT